MNNPRPFKVWSSDRNNKKSVTASSLEELVKKGKLKLGLPDTENVRLVLDEDGTEVDEEDYFTFLPHNSTLLMLRPSEKWRPQGSEDFARDEPDFMAMEGVLSERVKQLVLSLQKDVSHIITFSNDDLQQIVDVPTESLSALLQDTESYARALQDSCQRHLDERTQTTEAIDLLRLYHKARQVSPYVENDPSKKRKADNL
ncbi:DNA fragmentation factor subunit alpha-like [Gigantopelta aegis]|uniref:DNA fragmentation factor subunit alpha-like n=1 Tax=Gigantopelta aegis TaxID=1735272 RepID=UPI001B88C8FC|nr:DNA fragmentation factor subunit alpha-like [Gigantopelta aegis]